MTVAGRVTSIEDFVEWTAAAMKSGASRFELWRKLRGVEQERVHVSDVADPVDAADAMFSIVEQDRRVDAGQAVYSACAFRGKDKAPIDRAFVTPIARAVAVPVHSTPMASAMNEEPSYALASVLSTGHAMTRDAFALVQRENEHQRRTNESLVRATAGHFEVFAKGYERTLSELNARHSETIQENGVLRARLREMEAEGRAFEKQIRGLEEQILEEKASREVELAEVARKEKRDDEMYQHVKMLIPVVIAYASQRPMDLGPVANKALGAFVDSLKEPQLDALVGALEPHQRVFIETFLKAQKERRAKEKEKEQAKGSTAPKSDAAAAPSPNAAPAPSSPQAAEPSASPAAKERAPMRAPSRDQPTSPVPTSDEMERVGEIVTEHSTLYEEWLARYVATEAAKAQAGNTATESAATTPTVANENGGAPST